MSIMWWGRGGGDLLCGALVRTLHIMGFLSSCGVRVALRPKTGGFFSIITILLIVDGV